MNYEVIYYNNLYIYLKITKIMLNFGGKDDFPFQFSSSHFISDFLLHWFRKTVRIYFMVVYITSHNDT